MKKIVVIILLVLQSSFTWAQNMVPNPSFEDYTVCPDVFNGISWPFGSVPFPGNVDGWFSATQNLAMYYNACSANINSSIPNNIFGNKPAHSGDAYIGILAYSTHSITPATNLQSYVEIKLDSVLDAGQEYKISCYVKPAFNRNTGTNHVAVPYIAAVLTPAPLLQQASPIVDTTAIQMRNASNTHLNDTINWERITAYYTAAGGEQYLTIGGIYTPPYVVKQLFPHTPQPSHTYRGYYILDEVSVTRNRPCDTITYSHDTLVCTPSTTGLNIQSSSSKGTFKWNTGETSSTLVVNKSGKYWCTSDDDCHLVTDTFNITILQDTLYSVDTIGVCDIASYKISARDNAFSYKWNTGASSKDIIINDFGKYWSASVVDCKLYIDTIVVLPKSHLIDFVPEEDISICNDVQVTIGKQYTNVVHYSWNNGDTTCCISPKETGRYIVTVTGECDEFTDTVDVQIERCSDCLFIPNVFTPNNDGLNDYFGVRNLCNINSFSISIYNRWGQRVFTSNDVNFRWNGLQKADYAATGTYFYQLEYTTVQRVEVQYFKGDIILLR